MPLELFVEPRQLRVDVDTLYDQEMLESLMPVDISELEATAPDYGVGK